LRINIIFCSLLHRLLCFSFNQEFRYLPMMLIQSSKKMIEFELPLAKLCKKVTIKKIHFDVYFVHLSTKNFLCFYDFDAIKIFCQTFLYSHPPNKIITSSNANILYVVNLITIFCCQWQKKTLSKSELLVS